MRGLGAFLEWRRVMAALALTMPPLLALPYAMLASAMALGYWGIARGLIIEPPAFITNAITSAVEGLMRRTTTAVAAGPAQ